MRLGQPGPGGLADASPARGDERCGAVDLGARGPDTSRSPAARAAPRASAASRAATSSLVGQPVRLGREAQRVDRIGRRCAPRRDGRLERALRSADSAAESCAAGRFRCTVACERGPASARSRSASASSSGTSGVLPRRRSAASWSIASSSAAGAGHALERGRAWRRDVGAIVAATAPLPTVTGVRARRRGPCGLLEVAADRCPGRLARSAGDPSMVARAAGVSRSSTASIRAGSSTSVFGASRSRSRSSRIRSVSASSWSCARVVRSMISSQHRDRGRRRPRGRRRRAAGGRRTLARNSSRALATAVRSGRDLLGTVLRLGEVDLLRGVADPFVGGDQQGVGLAGERRRTGRRRRRRRARRESRGVRRFAALAIGGTGGTRHRRAATAARIGARPMPPPSPPVAAGIGRGGGRTLDRNDRRRWSARPKRRHPRGPRSCDHGGSGKSPSRRAGSSVLAMIVVELVVGDLVEAVRRPRSGRSGHRAATRSSASSPPSEFVAAVSAAYSAAGHAVGRLDEQDEHLDAVLVESVARWRPSISPSLPARTPVVIGDRALEPEDVLGGTRAGEARKATTAWPAR